MSKVLILECEACDRIGVMRLKPDHFISVSFIHTDCMMVPNVLIKEEWELDDEEKRILHEEDTLKHQSNGS